MFTCWSCMACLPGCFRSHTTVFQAKLYVDGLSIGYTKFAAPSQSVVFNGFLKASEVGQSQYASFKFADLDSACAGARAKEVTDLATIKQVEHSCVVVF